MEGNKKLHIQILISAVGQKEFRKKTRSSQMKAAWRGRGTKRRAERPQRTSNMQVRPKPWAVPPTGPGGAAEASQLLRCR